MCSVSRCGSRFLPDDLLAAARVVAEELHGGSLLFMASRAADAEGFSPLEVPVTLVALYGRESSKSRPCYVTNSLVLEELMGFRVDDDQVSFDSLQHDCRQLVHDYLENAMRDTKVLVPFRSSEIGFRSWLFHEGQTCLAGNHPMLLDALDQKAWVEKELSRVGVRTLDWKAVAAQTALDITAQYDVVVRDESSEGGLGFALRKKGEKIVTSNREWSGRGRIVSVAKYLKGAISLNVNCCVFCNGAVSFHGPSVQLIGIPDLTDRAFGYCGNDCSVAADLDAGVWSEVEQICRSAGKWLRSKGYLGAFGIDALLYEGSVYFVELNPRFQGSSFMSARADASAGRISVYVAHIAAFLRFSIRRTEPLHLLARGHAKLAHCLIRNRVRQKVRSNGVDAAMATSLRHFARKGIAVEPGGVFAQLVIDGSLTRDGKGLLPSYVPKVASIREEITGQAVIG